MDIQGIINSTAGLRAVSMIARNLPPRAGQALADVVAFWLASRREAAMVQGVRLNQWVARGECLAKDALDEAVRETLRSTARSILITHRYAYNLNAAGSDFHLDPVAQELIHWTEYSERGLVAVGIHMSNFDLGLQWLCTQGIKPLVLTIANPQGGRQMEFEIRKRTGMNLVPASVAAMKQAVRHLQHGGLVVTGMDRPVSEPHLHPRFFSRPAALPVHPIVLALKAEVPLRVLFVDGREKGKYIIRASELIEMERHPDREVETIQNAETVLRIMERFIRQAPAQWSMALPVWPDLMSQVP